MQGYNSQQQAAGAFWGGLGSLAGMATGYGGMFGQPIPRADGGEMRKRGLVSGPGGPVDDMIPAMLSDGEYVLPADTVKAIGKKKLDKVVKDTHTPAAIQRKRGMKKRGK
jgi:hypothetical protein